MCYVRWTHYRNLKCFVSDIMKYQTPMQYSLIHLSSNIRTTNINSYCELITMYAYARER